METPGELARSPSTSSKETTREDPRAGGQTIKNALEKVPTGANFGTARSIAVSAAIILTQFAQMIPYGAGINGAALWTEYLGVSQDAATWIVASYPLTQGAFVLMGGRLGTVYGHKNIVILAGAWWVIFMLVNGFMKNLIAFAVMRGLTGMGGAFMVPNAIALLTTTFPPGRLRNVSVGLFGAMAPIGAAGGTVIPGIFGQLTPVKYTFFFLAILGFVIFAFFTLVVPQDTAFDPNGKVDYIGAALGVSGLILFNFVWTQAPSVGWDTPYEYALLIVSILLLVLFMVWEWKFASEPILPLNIWTAPSFGVMILSAFLTFMGVGITIWYISQYNRTLRHYTPLSGAAAWMTLTVGGAVAAIMSAKAVPRLPAQYIMAIGSLCTTISLILVVTQPEQQIYWKQMFPALIFLSFGPDFLFTASQIIASNTVKRSQQGIAGSLIGTLLSYGLSTGLGFAGTVEVYTNDGGSDVIKGYRNALYLGIGMTGAATIIALLFVRIPKDEREGWAEGDEPADNRTAAEEPKV
jgi:MFS family permease